MTLLQNLKFYFLGKRKWIPKMLKPKGKKRRENERTSKQRRSILNGIPANVLTSEFLIIINEGMSGSILKQLTVDLVLHLYQFRLQDGKGN